MPYILDYDNVVKLTKIIKSLNNIEEILKKNTRFPSGIFICPYGLAYFDSLLVKLRPNLRSPASNYHQVVTECGP
jgi:hypothetical protein